MGREGPVKERERERERERGPDDFSSAKIVYAHTHTYALDPQKGVRPLSEIPISFPFLREVRPQHSRGRGSARLSTLQVRNKTTVFSFFFFPNGTILPTHLISPHLISPHLTSPHLTSFSRARQGTSVSRRRDYMHELHRSINKLKKVDQ